MGHMKPQLIHKKLFPYELIDHETPPVGGKKNAFPWPWATARTRGGGGTRAKHMTGVPSPRPPVMRSQTAPLHRACSHCTRGEDVVVIKVELGTEAERRLVELAVEARRPIPWMAEVLLARVLASPVPDWESAVDALAERVKALEERGAREEGVGPSVEAP